MKRRLLSFSTASSMRGVAHSVVFSVPLLGVLLTSGGVAHAQWGSNGTIPNPGPGWVQDERFTNGAGVRVGNVELHPGIGVEGGYDSNFFLRSSKVDPLLINAAPNAPVLA